MKNLILAAAFLMGAGGAAFADQNNKPADYISTSAKSSVSTNAFVIAKNMRKIRCEADPRLNRAEDCNHNTGSRSKAPAQTSAPPSNTTTTTTTDGGIED